MEKGRIEWIDIAKGLSIILVVYGHTGLNGVPYVGDWFAGYRMPFFFYVSGILFSPHKYPTLQSFVKKRWETLIRPYFFFSIIVGLWLFFVDNAYNIDKIKNILIYGWGGIALWFIPVLVFTQIFWYVITKRINSKSVLSLVVVLCGCLGFLSYKLALPNNYNICFVLTSTMFFGTGNLMNSMLLSVRGKINLRLLLMLLGSFLLSLTFIFNDKPEFSTNNLATPFTYSAAFGGTFFMCLCSMVFADINNNIARYIKYAVKFFGKNSYIVLAFHQVVIITLNNLHISKSGTILRISMWVTLVVLIFIINKYFPFIIGKKQK